MNPTTAAADRRSTRSLEAGFVASILLAAITVGVAALELGRVQHEAASLAADGQRTTYYLGDVGEQLARLRSHLSLGIYESPDEFGPDSKILTTIERNLDDDVNGLELGDGVFAELNWQALRPEVIRLRDAYTGITALLLAGHRLEATQRFSEERSQDTEMHDALHELQKAHRRKLLDAIARQSRRTARVRVLSASTGGALLGIVIVIWGVAITKLSRQARELRERAEQLATANADLDAFAGRVAHDLKNALGPICMAPSMLRMASTRPNVVLDIAARTERSSRSIVAVLDAQLAFSRAAASVDQTESSDVREAMRSVAEELEAAVDRVGASFEVHEMPEVHVRCSAGLLHVVLANLCGNAVKYLDGCKERHVVVAAEREDGYLRMVIEDTGPGIPIAARQRIFEPFFRVAGNRAPGTGIGLATVRRIVDARGGRIAVEAAAQGGSRFVVWLPIAEPDSSSSNVAGGEPVRSLG